MKAVLETVMTQATGVKDRGVCCIYTHSECTRFPFTPNGGSVGYCTKESRNDVYELEKSVEFGKTCF